MRHIVECCYRYTTTWSYKYGNASKVGAKLQTKVHTKVRNHGDGEGMVERAPTSAFTFI